MQSCITTAKVFDTTVLRQGDAIYFRNTAREEKGHNGLISDIIEGNTVLKVLYLTSGYIGQWVYIKSDDVVSGVVELQILKPEPAVFEKRPYTEPSIPGYTTFVVIGLEADDYKFATYTPDGILIPDYPNPTTRIIYVDREKMIATDELMMEYPVKYDPSI